MRDDQGNVIPAIYFEVTTSGMIRVTQGNSALVWDEHNKMIDHYTKCDYDTKQRLCAAAKAASNHLKLLEHVLHG
jgi:hypothetical protein